MIVLNQALVLQTNIMEMTKHLKIHAIHKYDNQKQLAKLAIEIEEQSNTGNILMFYQELDLLFPTKGLTF